MSDGESGISIRPNHGPQEAFLKSSADVALFGGAAGGGKMLSLDTLIPTPSGWTVMGKLKAGDLVFDDRGEPTNVVLAYPVEDMPESYELEFDDGSKIVACADHQWLTFTAADLNALTRRDDNWRAERRKKRESRATYSQGTFKSRAIAARNRANKPNAKPPPAGSVKTTREIANTLKLSSGRTNHAVPVARELQLPEQLLELDPYLLGLWLGDGTRGSGGFTTADTELKNAFASAGFVVVGLKLSPYGYTIHGLIGVLKRLGCAFRKHVPRQYLRASASQRLALLQGLMDTDGTACQSGAVEFTNTNFDIVQAAHELIVSLGWKARVVEGRATLNGKDCGPKWDIKWTPDKYVFCLKRKLDRQTLAKRRTTKFRYIVRCDRTPPVPMRCVTVGSDRGLFLAGREMIPTHNSFALLMQPLAHVENANFGAIIFRRTNPQIFNEGALWDISNKVYPQLGARPRVARAEWVFPSGAKVRFAHMEYEKSKREWDGSQIAFIGFDELTSFTATMFWYMLSRNRSTCGIRPYVRASCNPDADSWVAELVAWWINQETGYPIHERSGVIRWFIREDGRLVWFDSKKSAARHLVKGGLTPEKAIGIPKSFTFIPAKLEDNPILESVDPGYRANLMAMELVERERLLGGNWKIRPAAGLKFPRDAWKLYDEPPTGLIRLVRFWDKAGTEKGKGARTAGGLMGMLDEKDAIARGLPRFWVLDVQAARWDDATREAKIKATAMLDNARYGNVTIGMEQEPGSGGKHSAMMTINMLAGFNVYAERATTNKSARWSPLAAQQQIGNVGLVRGTWNWAETIEELDALAGDARTAYGDYEGLDKGKLKDIADSLSGAFKYLAAGDIGAIIGDLIASGDPDNIAEESKPLTAEEIEELPEFWRELVQESDGLGRDSRRDFDE